MFCLIIMSYLKNIKKNFKTREKEIMKKYDASKHEEYRYSFSQIGDDRVVEIHTKDGPLLRAVYDHIGVYNSYNGVWHWAWTLDLADRRSTKLSNKVKEFGKRIEDNYYDKGDSKENDQLIFYCTTDNIYIDEANIPNIIAMAMHAMDSKWFIQVRRGQDDQPFKKEEDTDSENTEKKEDKVKIDSEDNKKDFKDIFVDHDQSVMEILSIRRFIQFH